MKQNLPATLAFTLSYEGGYSANRADPGNWTGGRVGSGRLAGTKYGISAPLVARTGGLSVDAQKMRLLSEDDFRALAVRYFWEPMGCDRLPSGLDLMVFDHGFNAGAKTSIHLLQTIVGVERDGVIGPQTLDAIETAKLGFVAHFASQATLSALQKEMGIPQTGMVDQTTITMLEKHGKRLELLCHALSALQLGDYRSKKEFAIFGNGWLERARARRDRALAFVGATPVTASSAPTS
ncbi:MULTISPECIES: glycosyl hydrolase 108 family protein [unclassified Saccharibacter]|uniref:glycosyl hydrolase 108 family protein n=1 Tax=unclassified Saccharibacter TaxID=2648722 RepID=UPI001329086E|nr:MULTISPECIES: glycosyl hydrolase 108 family protein [unclassified Saccharibacter]MXV35821.1 hypothetical protein [Saccharibacter sp. EH611]MXV57942.1 hypothetical protein [Saccharibacter sp. EH70]MXV66337.1 hypothetical protein [Saccharibacter sp. EH60]